jgi:hypothetical protein
MGASTAYIAAGVRTAARGKAQVYDQFISKAGPHRQGEEPSTTSSGIDKVPVGPAWKRSRTISAR